jgi:hypothetical protein
MDVAGTYMASKMKTDAELLFSGHRMEIPTDIVKAYNVNISGAKCIIESPSRNVVQLRRYLIIMRVIMLRSISSIAAYQDALTANTFPAAMSNMRLSPVKIDTANCTNVVTLYD